MQYTTSEYKKELHDIYKALSVKQPYAGYISTGEKTIDVRSKPTKFRGKLVICASKDGKPEENTPGYGCTLALVELYDCKPLSELTNKDWEKTKIPKEQIEELKQSQGFGWFLRNPKPINQVPIKGQLGIFNLVLTKGSINQ